MGTGAEFFADIFGEGADVGAGATVDANSKLGVMVV